MKFRLALLIGSSLFLGLYSCTKSPINVPGVVKERFDGVLTQAASYAEKHGYDSKFTKTPHWVEVTDRCEYQQNVYKFLAKGGYEAEILPDGRLVRFFNNFAFNRGNAGKFEQQPQPTWSKEKTVQVAKEYLESMLGKLPHNMGEPKATFLNSNRWDKNYYQMGEWKVKWPRIDKSGYRFYNMEGITAYIYESEGAYAIYVHMHSHFDGVNFVPVNQEEIMPEAIKRAQKMTQQEMGGRTSTSGKLLTEYAMGHMEIVQPNYYNGTEMATRPDLNARLAWVIWFPWVADGDQNIDPKHPRRGVCVWIDAQNKKWLGGDAFEN